MPDTEACKKKKEGGPDDTDPFALAKIGCPPLSALALSSNDPSVLDALAVLHEDLRQALRAVESRQGQVKTELSINTAAEADQLEGMLEEALLEVRAVKNEKQSLEERL